MFRLSFFFFFQAEDGIRDGRVTGVQTCALPIFTRRSHKHQAPPHPIDVLGWGALSFTRGDDMQNRKLSRLGGWMLTVADRKSTRLNSSHPSISYAVFRLKKKRMQCDRLMLMVSL